MSIPPVTWSIDQVATWLETLGFPYRKLIKRNHIDGIELMELTLEDLEKMEIWSVGHRKKIMRAVQHLKQISNQYNVIAQVAYPAQQLVPQITVQKPTNQVPAQQEQNQRKAAPQQQHEPQNQHKEVSNNNNNGENSRPRRNKYERNYYSRNRDYQ